MLLENALLMESTCLPDIIYSLFKCWPLLSVENLGEVNLSSWTCAQSAIDLSAIKICVCSNQ